jgi:hypothetical protein
LSIAENIETVVATFQKGKVLGESGLKIKEVLIRLAEFEPRYRSVAFEGAAFGVGKNRKLMTLAKFMYKADKRHATQLAIGLGWAVAHHDLDVGSYSDMVAKEIRIKVLDGMGFYFSMHQRREIIRKQEVPAHINSRQRPGFDQGVGRAIWYITEGEIDKVVTIFNHFPEDRRANLWQGIGVASTYVGGCSDELITELKMASGNYRTRFNKGIRMAKESMRKAGL